MYATSTTTKTVNTFISASYILDILNLQQRRYVQRFELVKPIVPYDALRNYAQLCASAYKRHLKKCKNVTEHRALVAALQKRLKLDAVHPEFLKAIPKKEWDF